MGRISLWILVLISMIGLVTPTKATGQGAVRTASPPIVKVELSGKEPLPTGISASELNYGGNAGGGGSDMVLPALKNIQWEVVPPDIAYPAHRANNTRFVSIGSSFVACGYASKGKPNGILSYPSGRTETVSLQADFTRTNAHNNDCWSYIVAWSLGMELGSYTFTLEHPSGHLSHTWRIDYPPYPVISDLSDIASDTPYKDGKQLHLMMGFSPNETLTIRFYLMTDKTTDMDQRIWDYVATRTIQTDSDGAALLQIIMARDAPFWIGDITFHIDGYHAQSDLNLGSNRLVKLSSLGSGQELTKTVTAIRPTDVSSLAQVPSVWTNLKYRDLLAPGTQAYQTTVNSGTEVRLSFKWCADSPDLLQQIVVPLTVKLAIDETEIDQSAIMRYDDKACRNWVSILRAGSAGTIITVEFRYTLSASIFDGTATYPAGSYIQRIMITAR